MAAGTFIGGDGRWGGVDQKKLGLGCGYVCEWVDGGGGRVRAEKDEGVVKMEIVVYKMVYLKYR